MGRAFTFKVNYSGAPGQFSGDGANVVCTANARERLVPKKANDRRKEADRRLGLVLLPIPDVVDADAELARDVPLQYPEVEPATPEVVAE